MEVAVKASLYTKRLNRGIWADCRVKMTIYPHFFDLFFHETLIDEKSHLEIYSDGFMKTVVFISYSIIV